MKLVLMSEHISDHDKIVNAREMFQLRRYIRQLNASIEVCSLLKDQTKFGAHQWILDEVVGKKRRLLAACQDIVLKVDDTVEDGVPWFSVVTINYFRLSSKVALDQQAYVTNKLHCVESKLANVSDALKKRAESKSFQELADEIKRVEADIFDGLAVLKNVNAAC